MFAIVQYWLFYVSGNGFRPRNNIVFSPSLPFHPSLPTPSPPHQILMTKRFPLDTQKYMNPIANDWLSHNFANALWWPSFWGDGFFLDYKFLSQMWLFKKLCEVERVNVIIFKLQWVD